MNQFKFFILFFVSISLHANEIIFCSHPEVCNLLNKIKIDSVATKSLVVISGDPHEFEPNANQIKDLLTANPLVTGPLELNPWIKKISYLRSKNPGLKTISLKLNEKQIRFYSNGNLEALSHFWLYPQIQCDFINQLALNREVLSKINKQKIKCNVTEIENKISQTISKLNSPIVLTHDALSPLLTTYGKSTNKNFKIINLKGSNHHEEISSNSLKNLYQNINGQHVIWILERDIKIPDAINAKIKSSDKVINIDSANSSTSSVSQDEFQVLTKLLDELNR
jgi:ABC-type Zn uptake system ZnuABC Zn-binding protein ZnuA